MEESRNDFKILTGKPIGRPSRRRLDHIRMDFKEIGISTRNWTDALVNAALKLRIS